MASMRTLAAIFMVLILSAMVAALVGPSLPQ